MPRIKYVYSQWTDELLSDEEAEPECGKDYCMSCGDCLACYGDEECSNSSSGSHNWAVLVDDRAASEK